MTQLEKSFVNSFWGPGDAGYNAIQLRIKNSLQTLDEILAFLREKAQIEQESNKRLEKFYNLHQLGLAESGSLKLALDTLVQEGRHMVGHQEKLVSQTTQQNYEKLRNFQQMYAKNVAKIDLHMLKLHTRRREIEKQFVQCKEKYRLNCGQIKTFTLVCQTTCGKEMEKNAAKLAKLRTQHEPLRSAYLAAVTAHAQMCEIWTTDWAIALLNIYQLEIERIQICKLNLFSFCNHVATLCVDWDLAIDNARSQFARVAAPADAYDFADAYGTGDQIYEPPVFVEFMDGLDDADDARAGRQSRPAQFQDPDYSAILSRTFSTPSGLRARAPGESPTRLSKNSPSLLEKNGASPLYAGRSKELPPIVLPAKLKTNFLPPQGTEHPTSPSHAFSQQAALENGASAQKMPEKRDVHLSPTLKLQTNQNTVQYHPDSLLVNTGGAPLHKMPSRVSNYTTGTENDVFDRQSRLKNSNALSDYSNPTNYSSNTARSWALPRVKAPKDVQKEINRRLKDFLEFYSSSAVPTSQNKPAVPISKDFSIDFIAQALQDLNAGGDGDIDRFRRSVRENRTGEHTLRAGQPEVEVPGNSRFPASDYVDDLQETATRFASINFESPVKHRRSMDAQSANDLAQASAADAKRTWRKSYHAGMEAEEPHLQLDPRRQGRNVAGRSAAGPRRVESGVMELLDADLLQTVVRKSPAVSRALHGRALLQSPTKSYMNLLAIVDKVTPVTRSKYVAKAVAKHTYRCRESGELTFHKGWHMYIIHKQEDNWYVCELADNCGSARGTVGLVPYNYIIEGDNAF